MPAYNKTREYLSKHQLAPTKKLGQNFLVHRHMAEAIVNVGQVKQDDCIIEVGVGMGALTHPLATQVRKVIGFEVDSGLVQLHLKEHDLPDNVSLVHQDILTVDLSSLADEIGSRIKIMANLPYSITNPFLFHLLDNRHVIDWATVLVQKEVADRLTAAPNCKDYGVSTVLFGSCASIKKILKVKPEEFHPRPKVDSVVVRIEFHHVHEVESSYDFSLFTQIVRSTFGHRRKTLRNTLTSSGIFANTDQNKSNDRSLAEEALAKAGINPECRPETLDVKTFIRLTQACSELLKQCNLQQHA